MVWLPMSHPPRRSRCAPAALLLAFALAGCAREPAKEPGVGADAPNILWVIWDTVRADHLGLYGHSRATTPRLDAWARDARVFDDAMSPAGYTLPSHASMFTGLLPSEHCTHNGNRYLADSFTTLAERLSDAGYRTYLYSANPNVSSMRNLAQGFSKVEHPWSPTWIADATRIVREKLASGDHSSELAERLRDAAGRGEDPNAWNVKASGEIAQRALLRWLESAAAGPDEAQAARPWLAVLNYMEAHRPLIPARDKRLLVMSSEEVRRSYEVDRSWEATWEYTFGLRELSEGELELTRKTYDAALIELDQLFARLLRALRDHGHLRDDAARAAGDPSATGTRDTLVIVTSDHGEHLGEHHMLDHQYSLYEPLLRVPLIIRAPGRLAPGRDARPVLTLDLFPTLLEAAGVAPPPGPGSQARSLLGDAGPGWRDRERLAEEPSASSIGIAQVAALHPDWDPSAWRRRLRAFRPGAGSPLKLLRGSDGRRELYDLARDPLEARDLAGTRPREAAALERALDAYAARLTPCTPRGPRPGEGAMSDAERRMLEALGYLETDEAP